MDLEELLKKKKREKTPIVEPIVAIVEPVVAYEIIQASGKPEIVMSTLLGSARTIPEED